MTQTSDRQAAADAAHLASTVAFIKTYAKETGVDIGRLSNDPTLSQLQAAARKCGIIYAVQAVAEFETE